jgi:hypothetical protein
MEVTSNEKISYEQIFKSYWYAKYGEFVVVIHKDMGYVNATQLCKAYDKQFYNWHANKGTKAMIAGLALKQAITVEQMMVTVEGGSGPQKKIICGTYVHPVLLPHIVSWMDPTFANTVSVMVNDFYGLQAGGGDLQSLLEGATKKKPEAVKKVVGDGRPPVELRKSFKIFARNDPKFPYQAIETLEKGMKAAVTRFGKTPNATNELLLEINDIPDVVSLFNLIKSSGLIQTNKQAFTSRFPREALMQKIKDLSWSNVTRKAWMEEVLKSDLAMSSDSDSSISDDETDSDAECSDRICK